MMRPSSPRARRLKLVSGIRVLESASIELRLNLMQPLTVVLTISDSSYGGWGCEAEILVDKMCSRLRDFTLVNYGMDRVR